MLMHHYGLKERVREVKSLEIQYPERKAIRLFTGGGYQTY